MIPHPPAAGHEAPIRLFRSDLLEYFSHIHPAVVPAIWLPVAVYFLSRPLVLDSLSAGQIVAAFALGVGVWSLTEYVMHRFLFHFEPRNPRPWVKRMVFLFHGVHHAQPQCKSRLVMPPIVSIPLGFLFYALFVLCLERGLGATAWVDPAFAGFVAGYLAYDMIHYATHHFALRRGVLNALKRNHMLHHYRTPDCYFGVSSPVWDAVFGTLPARRRDAGSAPHA